ncbi:MAG: enoyl-CoA hydratase/isomerase family protein [Haloferacaceae archaeon]
MTAFDHTYETLDVTTPSPGVAHLRLDRRTELNAITPTVLDDLDDVLDDLDDAADADGSTGPADAHDVPVLVVSGAGRAFSVGADLDLIDGLDAGRAADLSRRGQRVFGRLSALPAPVVAAIDGYCLGGGMELAACADIRIASPDATFGQPECDRGLVPGWGGTQRLARLVGRGRAAEVILTADEYDAETMHRYGFVTELADDPLDRARERAGAFADRSPGVNRDAKRALGHDDAAAGLAFEAAAFGRLAARRGTGSDGSNGDDPESAAGPGDGGG